jgi:hypothetical protein
MSSVKRVEVDYLEFFHVLRPGAIVNPQMCCGEGGGEVLMREGTKNG